MSAADMTRLAERVKSLARAASPDIGFLDLTPAFVAAAAQGELLYYPDDTHWTSAGHLRAAEAVWSYLSQGGTRSSPRGRTEP